MALSVCLLGDLTTELYCWVGEEIPAPWQRLDIDWRPGHVADGGAEALSQDRHGFGVLVQPLPTGLARPVDRVRRREG